VVQQWLAPNISSDPLAGIGDRSVEDIETFLHTGAARPMGVAFGPMAEVVHNSLRYATKDDIHAIAVYLKEGPDRTAAVVTGLATPAELRQGRHLYLTNCAECHQDNGRGIPVDIHPKFHIPAVELVLTNLHAGGKFGQGAYKYSGGLHGVGAKCVNALSDWFTVEVYRDGEVHTMSFERGKTTRKLEVIGKAKGNDMRQYWGTQMAIVFQDAMTSLINLKHLVESR